MKALFQVYIKIIKIEPRCFHANFVQQFFYCSQRFVQILYFRVSFDTYYKVLKSTEVFWIKLSDVLVRERFLCSLFLLLVVRTAETQQQAHSGLGPLFPHTQSHPPCTTTNEDKAVGMGVLKRDVCCIGDSLTYLRLLRGADT